MAFLDFLKIDLPTWHLGQQRFFRPAWDGNCTNLAAQALDTYSFPFSDDRRPPKKLAGLSGT
jgi:hypothetical protein